MFGYRLVPADMYAVMLDAMRERASAVASVPNTAGRGDARVDVQRPPNPPEAGSTPAAPASLSLPVLAACTQFAFGDPSERALNLNKARQLQADGLTDAQIVATIKAGGDAVFVG